MDRKNVLDLLSPEAELFFLKEKSYFNFPLPSYFKFSKLINDISKGIKGKSLCNFYNLFKIIDKDGKEQTRICKPENFSNVNYKLLNNKDGKYAWRPFQIIHPVLYVSLVHEITKEENWKTIRNRFKFLKEKSRVDCMSIPVVSESEKSDKEEQIWQWIDKIEQKSVILGIEFEYLYQTDIVNCYGSIYTHSISWALHGKNFAKINKNNEKLIGNVIDKILRSMSYGQTNGIPQGSVLMDFIAEMVLNYVDAVLTVKLKEIKENYKIIRYRDDYRVFVNNPQIAEEIIKNLTEVLADLGMSLNFQKTRSSNNIIRDSMKSDKLYFIVNQNKSNNIQKELLIINSLAEKFPNSGSVEKKLQNLDKKIDSLKKIDMNIEVLISIVLNIAINNPKSYPVLSSILSKLLDFIEKNEDKQEIMSKIKTRFQKIPNIGYLQLWLQRITLKLNIKSQYDELLCKKVLDEKIVLWNSSWLTESLRNFVNVAQIIDKKEIEKLPAVMRNKEVRLFKIWDYYV